MAKFTVIHAEDNTAVALVDLSAGDTLEIASAGKAVSVQLSDDIAFGHKFAVRDIAAGEKITKYGETIGLASVGIRAGQHVHIHNVDSVRARGDLHK